MKDHIFHADDWGLSPAINEGILELARRRKLRSASCMATAPYLIHKLEELLEFAHSGVAVYLHFNLTYGQPLSHAPGLTRAANGEFFSHKNLLVRSLLNLISEDEVRAEAEAQLGRLIEVDLPVTGWNGHHHVHLLPGVARPLGQVMNTAGINKFLLLKDSRHRMSYLQTRIFESLSPSSEGVEPVYCGYLLNEDLRSRSQFMNKIEKGILPLLVHPALWNDFAQSGMTDSLRDQRVTELRHILEYLND